MHHRDPYRHPRRASLTAHLIASPFIWMSAAIFGAAGFISVDDITRQATGAAKACNIKGNISKNTGEYIYHVPGQEHYNETRIATDDGERWFCSETEARAAGWRKARNGSGVLVLETAGY